MYLMFRIVWNIPLMYCFFFFFFYGKIKFVASYIISFPSVTKHHFAVVVLEQSLVWILSQRQLSYIVQFKLQRHTSSIITTFLLNFVVTHKNIIQIFTAMEMSNLSSISLTLRTCGDSPVESQSSWTVTFEIWLFMIHTFIPLLQPFMTGSDTSRWAHAAGRSISATLLLLCRSLWGQWSSVVHSVRLTALVFYGMRLSVYHVMYRMPLRLCCIFIIGTS